MSGHSKWSTIKRHKGAQDAKRGKIFTKVVKEITVAARAGGGDPDGNPRLRRALDLARTNNVPSDNVTRAIKKGTGELEGMEYEELIYEGVGPSGVLFILQVMTDNRNRTAPEVRKIFERAGGQLGASGSSAWAFDERGLLELPADAFEEDRLFELAAEVGADDFWREGDLWLVSTQREALDSVRDGFEKAGVAVGESYLGFIPKTEKPVGPDDAEVLMQLSETLDDHDDVQRVFADFTLNEEALAKFGADPG